MTKWNNKPIWIREGVPLAPMTTWRVGGDAEFYAEPKDPIELAMLLESAEASGVPIRVLGGGSNLLIEDGSIKGLTVKLPSDAAFSTIDTRFAKDGIITCGAAVSLAALLNSAADTGLSGLEELAGIPGTVGGAVHMNAGNPSHGIGAYVSHVRGVDLAGRTVDLEQNQLHFAYRYSNLSEMIVTEIELQLGHDEPQRIREDMRSFIDMKCANQPLTERSAGCVFKNPRAKPAGLLIEEAGLKGFSIGAAAVSNLHANFIINHGAASCSDIRRIIDHVRHEVERIHNIELRLEIGIWM